MNWFEVVLLLVVGFVVGMTISLLASSNRRLRDKVTHLTDRLDFVEQLQVETKALADESRDLVDYWRGRHEEVQRALVVQVARGEGMSFEDIHAAYGEVLDREV